MTPTEYHALSARTRQPLTPESALIQAVLGIVGEAGELADAVGADASTPAISAELGDLCWYVAALGDALGINPEALWSGETTHFGSKQSAASGVVSAACYLAECAKKHLFHGKPNCDLVGALHGVADTARAFCEDTDCSIEEVWAANVAKLKARHPEGFRVDYEK